MKTIELTQGKVTRVSDSYYEFLSQWKWHFDENGYVVRFSSHANGKKMEKIYMHREIAKTPTSMFTDHIDHDRLNNCLENLRVCSKSENCQNSGMSSKNTSGYKGVSFYKAYGSWEAYIKSHGKRINLGKFPKAEDAARMYDLAAVELFGDFASLNFPGEWK